MGHPVRPSLLRRSNRTTPFVLGSPEYYLTASLQSSLSGPRLASPAGQEGRLQRRFFPVHAPVCVRAMSNWWMARCISQGLCPLNDSNRYLVRAHVEKLFDRPRFVDTCTAG